MEDAHLEVGSRVLECTRKPTARVRQAKSGGSGGGVKVARRVVSRVPVHRSTARVPSFFRRC